MLGGCWKYSHPRLYRATRPPHLPTARVRGTPVPPPSPTPMRNGEGGPGDTVDPERPGGWSAESFGDIMSL
ncbi:hypothetical protein CWC38_08975 [Kocuria tytonicola]|nr:hypothetical protein CWC38_08975 [Kocuria tytonicola]